MADKLVNGIAINSDWDPAKGDYKIKEPGYEERINRAKKEEKKNYFGLIVGMVLLAVPLVLLLLSIVSKI